MSHIYSSLECIRTIFDRSNRLRPYWAPARLGSTPVVGCPHKRYWSNGCVESGPCPARTRLTVRTVFANVRILITRVPARPSRVNVMSMPSARRNVCVRRKWPARARGFLRQLVLSPVCLIRSMMIRKRSAALPVQELRSLMSSRTQVAIGSVDHALGRGLPVGSVGVNESARGPEPSFAGHGPEREVGHSR